MRDTGDNAEWLPQRAICKAMQRFPVVFREDDECNSNRHNATRAEPRQIVMGRTPGIDPEIRGARRIAVRRGSERTECSAICNRKRS